MVLGVQVTALSSSTLESCCITRIPSWLAFSLWGVENDHRATPVLMKSPDPHEMTFPGFWNSCGPESLVLEDVVKAAGLPRAATHLPTHLLLCRGGS